MRQYQYAFMSPYHDPGQQYLHLVEHDSHTDVAYHERGGQHAHDGVEKKLRSVDN